MKKSKTRRLTTITPYPNTPTHTFAYSYRGKRSRINGIEVWLKGLSPVPDGSSTISPYHERASYIIDSLLGLNIVPTTVLRLVKGEVVSAQRWVGGSDPQSRERPPILLIFDFIISNSDRHQGNWFVKGDNRVWAIDNAYGFRLFSGELHITSFDGINRSKMKRKLQEILDNQDKLHKRLAPLISIEKVDAVLNRMAKVLKRLEKEG